MIPSKHATFLWNDDGDMLITGAHVVDQREVRRDEEYERLHRQYDLSYGACCAGWEEGDFRMTAEGLFLQMSMQGFASVAAFEEVLSAFAECDSCAWARQMQHSPEMWVGLVERRLIQLGREP